MTEHEKPEGATPQPTHQQLIAERGPLETGSLFYHMNAVQSWGIAADGSVKNVHPLG